MLKVVIFNGGRGAATLIPALLERPGLDLTSVVNAYDDGKSTGEIRRFFSILGPSDIRKVQELMLPLGDPDFDANLHVFGYRFPIDCAHDEAVAVLSAFADGRRDDLAGACFESMKVRSSLQDLIKEFLRGLAFSERALGTPFRFSDCSLMNCVYAGAILMFQRDIDEATQFIDRLFDLRGTVLSTSKQDKKLVALRENGEILYSEAEIVEMRSNVRIESIYLLDHYLDKERFERLDTAEKRRVLERHHRPAPVSNAVERALRHANVIIYSAGTQHSSLYPTYMSTGLARTISNNTTAFKAFVTNIGADYETPHYVASDYLRGAFRYLTCAERQPIPMQQLFDVILVNDSRLKQSETYVHYDETGYSGVPVRRIVDAFESASAPGKHDGSKVVETILALYDEARAAQRCYACE